MTDSTVTDSPEPVEIPEDEVDAFVCGNCEDTTPDDEHNTVTVGTRYGADTNGRTRLLANTESWCDHCTSNYTVTVYADECSYLAASDYVVATAYAETAFYYHEGTDDWRDYPEESEDEARSDKLMSYSTDVIAVLGWPSVSRHQDLLFGVELEMEARGDSYANDLVSILGGSHGTVSGAAILKSDGSLDDERGVELVTLPYTLAHHQQSGIWPLMLSNELQRAAKSGAGTSNCGIHVHINRAGLSGLTIGKMVVFLNNPENAAFVSMIAQRQSGGYCRRDEKKKITSALPQNADYNSRYDIINVTGGPTVEIRMFRGNLRPERVLKNIEFCHALVRFCESSGIVDAQRWGNFHTYVSKRRKEYPNLCGFLAEKSYLPLPRNGLATVTDL